MKDRLEPLIRRFLPSLIRLGADGPRTLRSGGGGSLVLVARDLCLYLEVDAAGVPARQRAGFVSLQVRRAAPFPDAVHDTIWFGDRAAVWYWSRARIQDLMDAPSTARTRFRAEGAYRGSAVADADAIELLDLRVPHAGIESGAGFEARIWQRGMLVASRWWPALPTAAQWQAFLRGGGLSPATPQPAARPAEVREQPLGGMSSRAWAGQLQAHWPVLAAVAGALVLCVFAFQLAAVGRAYREISATAQRVAALERHLDTIISARTAADQARGQIEDVLALHPFPSQTRIMGEVARITPGADWQVMMWQQSTPEILEVTLRGGLPEATAVVNAWEQSPLFQDVSPATGTRGDELTIRAALTAVGVAETSP